MATIYLKHPVHGSKVATMEAEAQHDEGKGWVRYNPAAVPEIAPEPPANAMVAPRHPLDHDGDGKPGGSLPGHRRRRAS